MTGSEFSSEAPKQTKGDIAHGVVKAGLSAIPAVGSPAAELLATLIRPSIESRRDSWIEDIANALKELEERVNDFELKQLQKDEAFTSEFLAASQIALRTHQEEKREALRNAVLNSALRTEPDDDIRAIFIQLIDRFTEWHLRILTLLDDPAAAAAAADLDYDSRITGSVGNVIEDAFPELKDRREFYDQIGVDLVGAGLIGAGGFHSMITPKGMIQRRSTPTGRRFVQFVRAPIEQHAA